MAEETLDISLRAQDTASTTFDAMLLHMDKAAAGFQDAADRMGASMKPVQDEAEKTGKSFTDYFAGIGTAAVMELVHGLEHLASFIVESVVEAFKKLWEWTKELVNTMVEITMKTVEVGSAMHDMALRTGVAVGTLSEFALGMKQSGGDMSTLATGLKFLSKSMLEVADGNKEMVAVYKELGVSAINADGSLRPIKDVLLEMAGAFQGMDEGAAKTGAALKVFGRAGVEMLPFLDEGTAGLQKMQEESRKLGQVWSQEDANAADAFGDALDAIKAGIDGVTQLIGKAAIVAFYPLVDAALEMTKRVVSYLLQFREQIQQFFKEVIQLGINFVANIADHIKQIVEYIVNNQGLVKDQTVSFLESVMVLFEGATSAILTALGAVADGVAATLLAMAKVYVAAREFAGDATEGVYRTAKGWLESAQALQKFGEATHTVKSTFSDAIEHMRDGTKSFISNFDVGSLKIVGTWADSVSQIKGMNGDMVANFVKGSDEIASAGVAGAAQYENAWEHARAASSGGAAPSGLTGLAAQIAASNTKLRQQIFGSGYTGDPTTGSGGGGWGSTFGSNSNPAGLNTSRDTSGDKRPVFNNLITDPMAGATNPSDWTEFQPRSMDDAINSAVGGVMDNTFGGPTFDEIAASMPTHGSSARSAGYNTGGRGQAAGDSHVTILNIDGREIARAVHGVNKRGYPVIASARAKVR